MLNKFQYGIIVCFLVITNYVFSQTKQDISIKGIDFTQVKIEDDFWKPRIERNRTTTILYNFKKCEETGRIDNFAIAGKVKQGCFKGIYYNDSDVFKVIEGASYSLAAFPDKALEHYLDSIIDLIGKAQEEDGYLFTIRTINPDSVPKFMKERWIGLKNSHELYNVGHMYEAAVAHYRATGKRNFLNIALKNAELICKTFGKGEGQLIMVPGHQEIEIGLVKLYQVTGDRRFLEQAKFFLDMRGRSDLRKLYTYGKLYGDDYAQDHLPVLQQTEAVGHAVRAGYMYAAMADVAMLFNDKDYSEAVKRLWNDLVSTKLYITGGIGSRGIGEAFGPRYYLPNLEAYSETCASIANMLFNYRMFLLNKEAKYMDVFERTLYNAFLAGISLSGNEFFYSNPLESDGTHKRSKWFDCSCCPTNVCRFLPSLSGYQYAVKDDTLYVNLFIGSHSEFTINNSKVVLEMQSELPWEGKINLTVKPEKETTFVMKIRLPSWSKAGTMCEGLYTSFTNEKLKAHTIFVNGKPVIAVIDNGYAMIKRTWKKQDVVSINFPMPVLLIKADERVEANRGKVAIQKGPLVYCAEEIDNPYLNGIYVEKNTVFESYNTTGPIDGFKGLKAKVNSVVLNNNKKEIKQTELKLIPYFLWAHRGENRMKVWFADSEKNSSPYLPTTLASAGSISTSIFPQSIFPNPNPFNDQMNPKSSSDLKTPVFVGWGRTGTTEWIQCDFQNEEQIFAVNVYWADWGDTSLCRLPESWNIEYLENNEWKNVYVPGEYPIEKDAFSNVEFAPVTTRAVRLKYKAKPGKTAGIYEWKIK